MNPADALTSVAQVADVLGTTPDSLLRLSDRAPASYRPQDRRSSSSSKWRHLDLPSNELKALQRAIYQKVLLGVALPDSMVGGVRGGSLLRHARPHVHEPVVLTVDLRDCFPSIDHRRVFQVFRSLGCTAEVARLLTRMTTFDRRLPQGAPTSPMLANLALRPLHEELRILGQHHGFVITQYFDDLAASGEGLLSVLDSIFGTVSAHGFTVKRSKVRLMGPGVRHRVANIEVTRALSVPRSYRQGVRERIRDAAGDPEVLDVELRSIRGQVEFVRSINPMQARALDSFADRTLPRVGRPGGRASTFATRRCRSFLEHRDV